MLWFETEQQCPYCYKWYNILTKEENHIYNWHKYYCEREYYNKRHLSKKIRRTKEFL